VGCDDTHCDYVRDRDRDHDIDNNGLGGFVGRSNLFDDFVLIATFLGELIDLIRYYLAFLMNQNCAGAFSADK
jgi:hypothetical protein